MSNKRGRIDFKPVPPGPGEIWRGLSASESRIRPFSIGTGTGTGKLHLRPSLRLSHAVAVRGGQGWILEPGVCWAIWGSIHPGVLSEPFWAGRWAGNGLFAFRTVLSAHGQVNINAPGPVCEVAVDGSLDVLGRLVLGRSPALRFRSVRSARVPRTFISGQARLKRFAGKGRVLVCWTPFWNEHLYERMTGDTLERSLFE